MLYLRAHSIRGARSNQGNTVYPHAHFLPMHSQEPSPELDEADAAGDSVESEEEEVSVGESDDGDYDEEEEEEVRLNRRVGTKHKSCCCSIQLC